MPETFTLTLTRDLPKSGPAFIDYALTPDPRCRSLTLDSGARFANRTDAISADIVTVNVFRVDYHGRLNLGDEWQFPPATRGKIIAAKVAVLEADSRLIGTVVYADGHTESFTTDLESSSPASRAEIRAASEAAK